MIQILGLLVILIILPGIAVSQETEKMSTSNEPVVTFFKVTPGARIRVQAQDITVDKIRGQEKTVTLEGTVESTMNDTIVLSGFDYPGLLTIPLTSINRFEIHRSKAGGGKPTSGGLCGLLVGAGTGGITGYNLGTLDFSRTTATLIGAGIFGFIGYFIGVAVAGVTTATEEWEEIPPESLSIGIVPMPSGGFGLASVIKFQL